VASAARLLQLVRQQQQQQQLQHQQSALRRPTIAYQFAATRAWLTRRSVIETIDV